MININENPYYKTTIELPIGKITLGSDGKSLVGLWTDGQRYYYGGNSNSFRNGLYRNRILH